MRAQEQISAATWLSTMCLLISFGGLFELPGRVATVVGVSIGAFIVVSIAVSVVLHRSNSDARLSVLWPVIIIAVPCLLFMGLSGRYAQQSFGVEYLAGSLFIWLLMPVVGYAVATPERFRQTTADTPTSLVLLAASAAAGLPFVCGLLGIVRRRGFVLAASFYFLSCILAFTVAGLARTAWRRW